MKKKTTLAVPPADIPIREIRGQRVLLDSDLAAIYGVQTKFLNRAIKRNSERFPADFVFSLTPEEFDALRCQTGTSNALALKSQTAISKPGRGGRRTLPYAFTEHGSLQAANVLRSPRAVAMGVFVIRAFVQMRATFLQSETLAKKLAELEARLTGRLDTHEHAIVHVMQQLVKLLAPKSQPPALPKPKIGFKL